MTKKIRVGVLFGGKSAEHEISLLSAKSVIDAIDKNKYEVVLIGINKSGEWFLHENLERCLMHADNAELIQLRTTQETVALVPKEKGNPLVSLRTENSNPINENQGNQNPVNQNQVNQSQINQNQLNQPLDVIFPVLHGTYGEDGTIQGLLKLANIPFVGASVLASAIGMDKDVMKRLLRDAGLPIANFVTLSKIDFKKLDTGGIKKTLGMPVFVKPANLGSSVGISKVYQEQDLMDKLGIAFEYDRKVLIEEFIPGREIECSVLGNENPTASLPGEIIPQHEFYSYEAKYLDKNGAVLEVPARVTEEECKRIQALAIQAYQVLCCEGMARVDMFLTKDGKIILNEINTIPGFTAISMYPKMWEASGLSYPDLIDRLIQLAIERFREEQSLKTTFHSTPLTTQILAECNEEPSAKSNAAMNAESKVESNASNIASLQPASNDR